MSSESRRDGCRLTGFRTCLESDFSRPFGTIANSLLFPGVKTPVYYLGVPPGQFTGSLRDRSQGPSGTTSPILRDDRESAAFSGR